MKENPTEEDWRAIPQHDRLSVWYERRQAQTERMELERENDDKAEEKYKQWLKDTHILEAQFIKDQALLELMSGEEDYVYRDRGEEPQTAKIPMRAKTRADLSSVVWAAQNIEAQRAGLTTGNQSTTTVNVDVNVRSEADIEYEQWRQQKLKEAEEQLQKQMEVSMEVLPALSSPTHPEDSVPNGSHNGTGTPSSSPTLPPTPTTSRIASVS